MGFYATTSENEKAAILPRISKTSYPRSSGVRSGQRYYSPGLARWLSRDPIGEIGMDGNFNLIYGFVRNDPIRRVDPFGLESINSCCCCCAESLDFKKLNPERSWDPTKWVGDGWRGEMAYNIKFPISLSYHTVKGQEKAGDCTLQYLEKWKYWEKPDLSEKGHTTGWSVQDSFVTLKDSPTFKEWRERAQKCNTTESFALNDSPSIAAVDWGIGSQMPDAKPLYWRTLIRWLRIKVVVTSAPSCNCAKTEEVMKIKMKQSLINGVPDWEHSTPPEGAWTF